ncbi:hypothetical protein HOY80DRAFT_989150, partial [Tuber brumale]
MIRYDCCSNINCCCNCTVLYENCHGVSNCNAFLFPFRVHLVYGYHKPAISYWYLACKKGFYLFSCKTCKSLLTILVIINWVHLLGFTLFFTLRHSIHRRN